MILEEMKDAVSKGTTIVGVLKSVEEIMEEVLKDKDFYEGSGGEIFAQFNFAKAILKRAKELGLHTAIETTAYTRHEQFVDLIQYVDFIYTDLKHYNNLKHQEVTAVKNATIIKNIHYAFERRKRSCYGFLSSLNLTIL